MSYPYSSLLTSTYTQKTSKRQQGLLDKYDRHVKKRYIAPALPPIQPYVPTHSVLDDEGID